MLPTTVFYELLNSNVDKKHFQHNDYVIVCCMVLLYAVGYFLLLMMSFSCNVPPDGSVDLHKNAQRIS